jgi:Fe-S-cluster containining protein
MDFRHTDYQNVKGLNCHLCKISSCKSSVGFYRTPVSKLDAEVKKMNFDNLEWENKTGFYWVKRNPDTSCSFFDRDKNRCQLNSNKRPNACLVYPVRIYMGKYDIAEQVILTKKCPYALSLFDFYARREPSVVNYIKGAVKLFEWDHDFRLYVIEQTKDFSDLLRIGPMSAFRGVF